MKENWEGEKVASFSLNTRSSNSTGCSYSSGLLWINDRIPQRRGPKDFSLSLMEFTFMYMKKTNLAMDLMLRKVFQPQQEGRWGVRGESFESSKKKKEMKYFFCFPRHHASYTLQYSFASSMNCQFICL